MPQGRMNCYQDAKGRGNQVSCVHFGCLCENRDSWLCTCCFVYLSLYFFISFSSFSADELCLYHIGCAYFGFFCRSMCIWITSVYICSFFVCTYNYCYCYSNVLVNFVYFVFLCRRTCAYIVCTLCALCFLLQTSMYMLGARWNPIMLPSLSQRITSLGWLT